MNPHPLLARTVISVAVALAAAPALAQNTTAAVGGRVTRITDPAGRATDLSYDAAGNLVQRQHGNGASSAWTYDAASPRGCGRA